VATADADPDMVPDWPAEVQRPRRHPLEAVLSTVMRIGPLRRY